MEWTERIVSDAGTCGGRPRVKGTRISVEFLLGLKASGWSEEQILAKYPHLTREDLRAVFAYLRTLVEHDNVVPVERTRPITSLKGMLPRPKRSVTLQEMGEAIARGAAGE